ncbi:sulfurtransferase [Parapedobacter koreensis]|uniref:Thiosulfate/3-mercaptopyruvate sulfurtransferase n=1 Tax=Parapedobacter koreensis TaxID=332977 RepID=A0A1H7SJ41_9SPHI|nr:sulfurtransferase [Parapedobacter koreensis]SEL72458.1 thiosulfate/3-mercaptopyruvate sulfurtransferase [Parapedobacter koreensis]
MDNHLPPIIDAQGLSSLFHDPNLIVIDASGGKEARHNYEQRHIDGALFADLETQLADTKSDPATGGRHPLPTASQFADTLAQLGITKTSHIVIYDDKHGSNAAARLWWMLRAIGHQQVQVLDGGLQAAEQYGLPINNSPVERRQVEPYAATDWLWPKANIDEVADAAQDANHIVIDVRDADRYQGLTEPLDLIAGHIPGAINVPYTTNLTPDGRFKSPTELRALYTDILGKKTAHQTIVHCGSGVTACHTLLAMASAGFDVPKLYVGSWSEWSRSGRPMATA